MNSKAIMMAAGFCLACSSASLADPPERTRMIMPGPPAFAEVDSDGDQMITDAEFVAFIEKRRGEHVPPPELEERRTAMFAEADADGDGQLSSEEFEAMPRPVIHRKMRMRDPKEFFARGDTDGDSVLNEQEFAALMEAGPRPRRHPGEFDEQ